MAQEKSLIKDFDETEENRETEQIREQIEETRLGMSETIDAIQEKLSFENLSEQVSEQVSEQISNVYQTAKDKVYDAAISKAGQIMNSVSELKKTNIYHKVTENPFPLFLIGLGAGLLVFSNFKKNSSRRNGNSGRKLASENGGNGAMSMMKKTQDKLSETASSAYHSVADTAGSAYQSVSDAAGKTYEKIGELGSSAHEQYEHYIEEKPLAIGVAAFAVGAGIGLMLPTTRYEEEMMGEMSRGLVSKAQDKTQEAVNSLKNAAGQAVETVRENVREELKNQTQA